MSSSQLPLLTLFVVLGALVIIGAPALALYRSKRRDTMSVSEPTEQEQMANAAMVENRTKKSDRFAQTSAKVDMDGLTGVGNRRRFDSDLAEVADGSGEDVPVSLAMFDIDNFRYYNDAHGKQAGNDVLRKIAELIAGNLRETDVVYRYSGVKFVALLPGANVDNASVVVERIRVAVESASFDGEEVQPLGRVTMSVGVAEAAADNTSNLIEAADAALEKAKTNGRNKVVIEADIK